LQIDEDRLQMKTLDPDFRVLFEDPHKTQTLRSEVGGVCDKAETAATLGKPSQRENNNSSDSSTPAVL